MSRHAQRMAPEQSVHGDILRATELLRSARRVLVITGAGMSADSGLPTYRGVGGLYDRELTDDGISIEDALSGAMFARDPALTWKYISQIERACRGAMPNAGHEALAELASHYERFCVLTQNVDGFHAAAGSRDVIEMHGTIHRLQCTQCANAWVVEDYAGLAQIPPACGVCGGLVRPAVVLFGEMLPDDAVCRYEFALAEGFDLVLVVGTSAVFPYIAAPVEQAASSGCATIEINPQRTMISDLCDVHLRANAAHALTALLADVRQKS
ncbi:SIR2 family NAD-dependent protein deacylase [Salinisphaera dokdonensis]|uniref:SIR2 family NAD-dependent protein deacylase n=1 Tax=Salinisphaera dokdonensis TaxID=454598 RepID=UPI00333F7614